MALKAVVSKLDDVAEGFRGLYKPAEGGIYVLEVEPVELGTGDKKQHWGLENVHGLKAGLGVERERADNAERAAKKANDALAVFGEIGDKPEKIKDKLTKYDELVKIDPKKEADRLATERVELWAKDEGTKYQTQLAEKDTKIAGLESALDVAIVDSAIMSGILEHKGSVPLLTPHVRSVVRRAEKDGKQIVQVVQNVNGQMVPRVGDAQGNPMSVSQLVAEMKKDPVYAPCFPGTGASGSGAQGNGGGQQRQQGTTLPAGARPVDKVKAGLEKHRAAN